MNNMTQAALMDKIQKLSFAQTETGLFLNTHPDCTRALDYYHKLTDELNAAREEYANTYGPIIASESMGDRWTWIEGAWPWHNGFPENGAKGGKG